MSKSEMTIKINVQSKTRSVSKLLWVSSTNSVKSNLERSDITLPTLRSLLVSQLKDDFGIDLEGPFSTKPLIAFVNAGFNAKTVGAVVHTKQA